MERTLEIELKKRNIEVTLDKIREALGELELSEVKVEGKRFIIRSKVKELVNDILRVLRIRIPSQITTPKVF